MLYFVDTIMNWGVGVSNISRIQKTKATTEMKEKLVFFIYFRRGRLKAAAHPTMYSEHSWSQMSPVANHSYIRY